MATQAIGADDWAERVKKFKLWDGCGLRPHLMRELILEGERLALV
jgi:hypothetical protein